MHHFLFFFFFFFLRSHASDNRLRLIVGLATLIMIYKQAIWQHQGKLLVLQGKFGQMDRQRESFVK